MTLGSDVMVAFHGGSRAGQLLGSLGEVYADAYGVEPVGEKVTAFQTRATRQFGRAGFALVTAVVALELVGFAFGSLLPVDTRWWDGLEPEPAEGFAVETGQRTFVLSEIEVRRSWQGRGVGRALHDGLLGGRGEERATLATGADAPVQAVYEGWGWRKVGRVPGVAGEYFSAYDLLVLPLPIGTR